MFSIILNVIGSLMHLYVADRLSRLPIIRARIRPRFWWIGAVLVWLVYLAGVQLGDEALDWRWWPGQFAMTLLGILFVMTQCLLAADILTGFGLWWRAHAAQVRTVGAAAGVLLSAFAIFQAVRTPVVVEHELALNDLPPALDGTVLVAVSDIHLGAQRRAAWLERLVERINSLQPAAVLLLGDQVEDEPTGDPGVPEALRGLRAPRGVWAVTGNHEYYGDAPATIAEFERGGVRWLRDEQVDLLPGLGLAGLDDIGRVMRSGGDVRAGIERLPSAPPGTATILMAHIPAPALVDIAAARGIDLMLSGHTHGGQIWPFSYLVQRQFPHLVGAHRIGGMQLVITRGAGSWGPRMRLWKASEIVKLTLRARR